MTLPAEAFALFDNEAKLRLTKGEATLYVGFHQPDEVSEKLTGSKPEAFTITIPKDEVLYEGKGLYVS